MCLLLLNTISLADDGSTQNNFILKNNVIQELLPDSSRDIVYCTN